MMFNPSLLHITAKIVLRKHFPSKSSISMLSSLYSLLPPPVTSLLTNVTNFGKEKGPLFTSKNEPIFHRTQTHFIVARPSSHEIWCHKKRPPVLYKTTFRKLLEGNMLGVLETWWNSCRYWEWARPFFSERFSWDTLYDWKMGVRRLILRSMNSTAAELLRKTDWVENMIPLAQLNDIVLHYIC